LALLENGDPGEAEKFFLASWKRKRATLRRPTWVWRARSSGRSAGGWGPALPGARRKLDANYKDALLDLPMLREGGKKSEAIALYKNSRGMRPRRSVWRVVDREPAILRSDPRLEKAVADSPTIANRLALATAYRMTKRFS